MRFSYHPRDQVAATPTLLTTPYLATQDWVVKVAVAVIPRSYPGGSKKFAEENYGRIKNPFSQFVDGLERRGPPLPPTIPIFQPPTSGGGMERGPANGGINPCCRPKGQMVQTYACLTRTTLIDKALGKFHL